MSFISVCVCVRLRVCVCVCVATGHIGSWFPAGELFVIRLTSLVDLGISRISEEIKKEKQRNWDMQVNIIISVYHLDPGLKM